MGKKLKFNKNTPEAIPLEQQPVKNYGQSYHEDWNHQQGEFKKSVCSETSVDSKKLNGFQIDDYSDQNTILYSRGSSQLNTFNTFNGELSYKQMCKKYMCCGSGYN